MLISQFDSKNWISYISYISIYFIILNSLPIHDSLPWRIAFSAGAEEWWGAGSWELCSSCPPSLHGAPRTGARRPVTKITSSPSHWCRVVMCHQCHRCHRIRFCLKCFEKAESIWKHQKQVVWTDLTHLTRFLERMLWESTRISRLEIDKIQEWLTMTVVLRSPVSGMSAVAFFSKPKSLRMWLARFGPRRRGLLSSVSPHDAKRSTQGPRWSKKCKQNPSRSNQNPTMNSWGRRHLLVRKHLEPLHVRTTTTTTSNMFQSPGPKPGISSAPFFTKTKLITARSGPTMHHWPARLGTTRHMHLDKTKTRLAESMGGIHEAYQICQMHPEIFNVHNVHHVLWYTAKHYTWIQWIKHIRLCIELFVVFS